MKKSELRKIIQEEVKKQIKETNFKVGSSLTIPKNLTTDPINRQGQTGRIIKFTEDGQTIHIKFSDGKVGKYDLGIWKR